MAVNPLFWEADGSLSGDELAVLLREQAAHRASILNEVLDFSFDGIPGQIALMSPKSFVVLTTGDGSAALVAGVEYGAGRVVAFAHEGIFSSDAPGARKLVANATAWARHRPGGAAGQLRLEKAVDDDFDAEEFQRFVANGGAAIIGRCPWGWRCLNANAPLAGCGYNRGLLPMGLAFGDGYFAPPGGVVRINASGNVADAAAWVFAARLRAGWGVAPADSESPFNAGAAEPAAAAPAEELDIVALASDALLASSGELSDARVPLGLAATGSSGGWWAPVGTEHHVDVRLPAGYSRVVAVRLVCANVDACPQVVSLSRLTGGGGAVEEVARWAFERDAGADKTDPVTLTFGADPLVLAGSAATVRLAFHGIVNSFYIGINSIQFVGTRAAAPAAAGAARGGAAVGGAGAQPLAPSDYVPPGASTLMALPSALPQHLHRKIAAFIFETIGAAGGAAGASSAPSPASPLRRSPRADLLAAAIQLAPDVILRAAGGAAASFPGAAPASADRSAARVRASRSHGNDAAEEWSSTHIYASPGDIIIVDVEEGMVDNWHLRIGCHADDISAAGEEWLRWPVITQCVPLPAGGTTLRLTATHGGPIYLQSTAGATPIVARVSGGVAAPHASATTGFALVDGPAPWGELVGRHMILTVRREALLKHRATLAAAAALWDEVITNHRRLSPSLNGERPERIVPDVQTSCGLMHSGYPIMVDEFTFDRCVLQPFIHAILLPSRLRCIALQCFSSQLSPTGMPPRDSASFPPVRCSCSPSLHLQDSMLDPAALKTDEGHLALWGLLHE